MPKINFNKSELPNIAKKVLMDINDNVLCFKGEMGAGKTTTIKHLLKELEVVDQGNSPTFGIVNEYHNKNGEIIAYHFDCYRLNSEEEAFDLGIEEYLYSGKYVFIEWPDVIANLLPTVRSIIKLSFIDENTRSIEY
ncbi:tRNA (adenosine(37)-N6)-threonylcarbamoyltransferase complex ATPase subunit type 1 TsaE [Croceivirga radicis]|uniref:tRNA (adenosine(37)-N6)-threonylcarbamoyltransferase complex ATPase subunit type 1 TsaE n=1 Tax=Croceivirga radicis TaxID=1929488 RepID=UPI000255ABE4|nr:tRNA (adenosine(37)-N6)-threonylcarbamoyltransferase complex ATPase subunit type 1 TsaE [Croceivirga radicis]